MDISEEFVEFALMGQDWVLWLLVALSVLSVGVMIERGLYFRRHRVDLNGLEREVKQALKTGDPEALEKHFGGSTAMAARVALCGVRERDHGADAVAEAMNSEKTRVRQEQESHLVVLGTLGNNAPFIGLLGTVLGIMHAFANLSMAGGQVSAEVMAGISEALVATGVGLLVALPAVIAFNWFQRIIKGRVVAAESLGGELVALLRAREARSGGAVVSFDKAA